MDHQIGGIPITDPRAKLQILPGPHYVDIRGNIIINSTVRRGKPYVQITEQDLKQLQELYNNSKLYISQIKNSKKDEECHIIGTGPSLSKFAIPLGEDFWRNKLTIGVNGSPMIENIGRFLKYWVMGDDFINPTVCPKTLSNYIKNWLKIEANNRPICFARKGVFNKLSEQFQYLPINIFESSAVGPGETHRFYWANSTVQIALGLARHLGCNPIYLWGVDYTDVHTHCYNKAFDNRIRDKNDINKSFRDVSNQFAIVKKSFPSDVKIFNCNLDSKLEVFQRIDPSTRFSRSIVSESFIPKNCLNIDFDSKVISYGMKETLACIPFDALSKSEFKALQLLVKKFDIEK